MVCIRKCLLIYFLINYPDNKVHGANVGPTWVLSASDGPHVGPMNLALGVWMSLISPPYLQDCDDRYTQRQSGCRLWRGHWLLSSTCGVFPRQSVVRWERSRLVTYAASFLIGLDCLYATPDIIFWWKVSNQQFFACQRQFIERHRKLCLCLILSPASRSVMTVTCQNNQAAGFSSWKKSIAFNMQVIKIGKWNDSWLAICKGLLFTEGAIL